MLIDFTELADMEMADTDVCVIGAGAAGVTLARSLGNKGHEVVLLESGGLDQEDAIDDLMRGRDEGFPYYPLHESRLRFYGGTTLVWGGRCAQLDDIDFETRPWVPYSGWPIDKRDLTAYYDRARALLELDPIPDNDGFWEAHDLKRPGFDPNTIAAGLWQFDTRADRFAAGNAGDLFDAPRVRVVTHATVTGIRVDRDGRTVQSVRFANLAGGRGEVRARCVVLAAGGLENPRLLLASNDVHAEGLGNDHDLVGRFFMEHPHARGGRIVPARPRRLLRLLPRAYTYHGKRYAVVGRPADALQEKEGLLNTSFTIAARQHPDDEMVLGKKLYAHLKHRVRPRQSRRLAWHTFRRTLLWSRETFGPALGAAQLKRARYGVYVVVRAEQSPNPASRLRLTEELDPLGVPRPALSWQFRDIDKHSVLRTMLHLGSELQRLGLGRLEPAPWLTDSGTPWQTDRLISNHPVGGYHHMGTTRMAASPRSGVVDADARVFGIDNLYVAGSSVFPTAGWANPTLTILALTLRLADHLDAALRR